MKFYDEQENKDQCSKSIDEHVQILSKSRTLVKFSCRLTVNKIKELTYNISNQAHYIVFWIQYVANYDQGNSNIPNNVRNVKEYWRDHYQL